MRRPSGLKVLDLTLRPSVQGYVEWGAARTVSDSAGTRFVKWISAPWRKQQNSDPGENRDRLA